MTCHVYLHFIALVLLKLDELITRTYQLEEVNEAFSDMLNGEVARGLIRF